MKVIRWLFVVVVLAGGIWLGITRAKPKPSAPTLTLSDGLQLALRHAAVTNLHAWRPRGPIANLIGQWLPARFDSLLGLPNPSGSTSSGTDVLGVWFTVYDPAARTWQTPDNRVQIELLDEDGCVFRPTGQMTTYGHTGGRSQFAVALNQFGNYPRRSATLRARVLDRDGKVEGELTFAAPPPPPPAPAAPWTPEPLPTTQTTQGLSITLKRITALPRETSTWDRAPYQFSPEFDLRREGQPADDWRVDGYLFSDATGNQGYTLCPREPAWRVEARLIKQPTARFEAYQLWTVGTFPVPPPGELQALDLHHAFGDTRLQAVVLAGPGKYSWSNDVCVAREPAAPNGGMSLSSGTRGNDRLLDLTLSRPFLLLRGAGLHTSTRLSARATTDTGQVISRVFPQHVGEAVLFDFEGASGARMLSIELIAQQPLRVQFTAPPPVLPDPPTKATP